MPESHAFQGNRSPGRVIIGCISQLLPGQGCNYHITPNRRVFISDAPPLSELLLLYINNWVGRQPSSPVQTTQRPAPPPPRPQLQWGQAHHLCSTFGQIHASRRLGTDWEQAHTQKQQVHWEWPGFPLSLPDPPMLAHMRSPGRLQAQHEPLDPLFGGEPASNPRLEKL